jgi:DNA-binding CsgD family transcriptional regulator
VQPNLARIDGGDVQRLTERQKDCLRLVAQGYTSKEIGRALDLSPSTVDNHILAAVQATGSLSRGDAARLLARSEDRQNLPRELQGVAESTADRPFHGKAEAQSPTIGYRRIWSLPPVGGLKNELDGAERTIRIIQVAVVGFGAVMSLALLVAGAFRIFS